MKFLNRISIRNFLLGLVGILVCILAVQSALSLVGTYRKSTEFKRVALANKISDNIIEAAGYEAQERGFTAAALSAGTEVDGRLLQRIRDMREKGDKHLKQAYADAATLTEIDPTNTAFGTLLGKVNESFRRLETARRNADANIGRSEKTFTAKNWIPAITGFIDTNAELRLAGFASTSSEETHSTAQRMNLEIKQAVWLVSEYAGRERAVLGKQPVAVLLAREALVEGAAS